MTNLPPLKGAAKRIKFYPCPEGQDAKPGTKIGEIDCDQCERGTMAHVIVGKGQHVYAFHNTHHAKAINEHVDKPCGCTLLRTNGPQGREIIRHWTAQRYSKGETARVEAPKQPTAPQARSATDRKPAAATGAGTRPAAKPGVGTASSGTPKRPRFFPWS